MKVAGFKYELTPDDVRFCETIVCAGFHEIKFHTLALVEDLLDAGVPGDFAECGVLYGAHPAIMLRSLLRRGERRLVHLFDSFQGIPRATAADTEAEIAAYGLKGDRMEPTGVSVSSLDNTLSNLRGWGVFDSSMVRVHPGWFEETLPTERNAIGPLALLRVDVDLYESTRAVYTNLWDKVVPGGYVIDDDYGLHEDRRPCRRAMEEVCGLQEAIAVEGQPTTSWWRKPVFSNGPIYWKAKE